MEELEKIRAFLKKINAREKKDLIKFEYFDDGSCSISHWEGTYYLEADTLQDLLDKIDNYQWDTNTNNQNTAPAKK